jgi:flagellar FliJ protein
MAARFHFGLERVRDLRAHTEEQAKEQFAASLNHLAHGEAMLRAAEHQLELARKEQGHGAQQGALSGRDLLAHQAFVERLERSRLDAIIEVQQRESKLVYDRQALARASQEREVLDKLKHRQKTAHLAEVERVERVELDDMAMQNFVRRQAA